MLLDAKTQTLHLLALLLRQRRCFHEAPSYRFFQMRAFIFLRSARTLFFLSLFRLRIRMSLRYARNKKS